MMNSLQKVGGVVAPAMAATWIVGIAVFLGVLTPAGFYDEGVDPADRVAVLVDNHAIASLSYLISYVLFGILLVVLALSLHERLKTRSPALASTATAIGLIWAGLVIGAGMLGNVGIGKVVDLYGSDPTQAGSAWLVLEAVVEGLGGQNEVAGGLWVLLISWAALRARQLPRALNYLGLVSGGAGLATVVPVLKVFGAVEVLGAVFGLGMIVWFIWLGILMLRTSQQRAGRTPAEEAA